MYKWYKLNSETPETVISNTRDLDLRNFGYGFYEVEVIYNNTTGPQNCIIKRRIKVSPKPRPVLVNPHLIQRAF